MTSFRRAGGRYGNKYHLGADDQKGLWIAR